jgi:hypothetical protein
MSKSTYCIKETKNGRKFIYTGDLREATEKARKDLKKEEENEDIEYWQWIKRKAQAAIRAHEKKIGRIEAFIQCAERTLEKGEADNE